MLVQCRTGLPLQCPDCTDSDFDGFGFKWYDVGQKHLLVNVSFVNCGANVDGRGCNVGASGGCSRRMLRVESSRRHGDDDALGEEIASSAKAASDAVVLRLARNETTVHWAGRVASRSANRGFPKRPVSDASARASLANGAEFGRARRGQALSDELSR